MDSKICPQCSTAILGRSDKKFCSDQCRAGFNNKRKNEDEKLIIKVNAVLRKNRMIMKRLNPQGSTTVRKDVMDELGFNFKYFTNVYKTKTSQYFFCYDHGFMVLENNKILLVNYQSYMKNQA